MTRNLSENTERKLYAESMGRCMNPNCKETLFKVNGDIIERAHIIPYAKTANNSFDNLIILCPNCHTNYDKNSAFSEEELLSWKKIRQQELNQFFNKKFNSFESLKKEVMPLLIENKKIFETYYLGKEKELWNIFENKILANNTQLRYLFEQNLDLFQKHTDKSYSNLEYIKTFILHTEEFEKTRFNENKIRKILFPQEINSMFGIKPIKDSFLQSTESLEDLITKLRLKRKKPKIFLGINQPYIRFIENNKSTKVYLTDTPRIRQLYFNYKCFKQMQVRLEALNWALKYLNKNNIKYCFIDNNNLKEITVNGKKIIFVYEYCLSKLDLVKLDPEENSFVVNLHNWNGESCISKEALNFAHTISVTLLTTEEFCEYIKNLKNNILNNIKNKISLFNDFENVYLFGSTLCANKVSNDIDILLIYSKYSNDLISNLNYISSVLTNICKLPIHFTVLSIDEQKDINFLEKLNSNYIKLK